MQDYSLTANKFTSTPPSLGTTKARRLSSCQPLRASLSVTKTGVHMSSDGPLFSMKIEQFFPSQSLPFKRYLADRDVFPSG